MLPVPLKLSGPSTFGTRARRVSGLGVGGWAGSRCHAAGTRAYKCSCRRQQASGRGVPPARRPRWRLAIRSVFWRVANRFLLLDRCCSPNRKWMVSSPADDFKDIQWLKAKVTLVALRAGHAVLISGQHGGGPPSSGWVAPVAAWAGFGACAGRRRLPCVQHCFLPPLNQTATVAARA